MVPHSEHSISMKYMLMLPVSLSNIALRFQTIEPHGHITVGNPRMSIDFL